jgi:hypothetical protein
MKALGLGRAAYLAARICGRYRSATARGSWRSSPPESNEHADGGERGGNALLGGSYRAGADELRPLLRELRQRQSRRKEQNDAKQNERATKSETKAQSLALLKRLTEFFLASVANWVQTRARKEKP